MPRGDRPGRVTAKSSGQRGDRNHGKDPGCPVEDLDRSILRSIPKKRWLILSRTSRIALGLEVNAPRDALPQKGPPPIGATLLKNTNLEQS